MSGEGLPAALQHLEQAWAAAGSDVAARLAPGSVVGEIEAAVKAAGLAAGEDLVTWFGWHNGRREKVADIGPAMVLLSLDEALALRDKELHLAEELAVEYHLPWDPPDRWDPAWLPVVSFVHGGAFVVVAEPRAVREVWRYEIEVQPGRRVAGSLAQLVDGWCRLIEGGYWMLQDRSWKMAQLPPPELRPFQP